jgi:DNA modification methylase
MIIDFYNKWKSEKILGDCFDIMPSIPDKSIDDIILKRINNL